MAKTRHFLTVADFSAKELLGILEFAKELKQRRASRKEEPLLAGKVVGMIFQKPSCRTRISFEAGICQLSGSALNVQPGEIQMGQREPIADIARTISRYLDAIIIRAYRHEDIAEFAEFSRVPVINGLSDRHHPCQALADMMTLEEQRGGIKGKKICYIGDGNNVCCSLIEICNALGVEIVVSCPEGYEPTCSVLSKVEIVRDPTVAVIGADAIYTDVWTSMGQEQEAGQRSRDFQGYTITSELLSRAPRDAVFMHCLPAHRGEEVEDKVFESRQSVVFEQAENRLHVQKAVLSRLI